MGGKRLRGRNSMIACDVLLPNSMRHRCVCVVFWCFGFVFSFSLPKVVALVYG